MKDFLKAVFFVFTLMASTAHAAFVGHYDFANWTKLVDGGSIDTGSLPNAVGFVSNNNWTDQYSQQDYIIDAVTDGVVNFNWFYTTADNDGSQFDPFGYVLNNNFFQLSVDGLFEDQFGTVAFNVSQGDIFGFRMASLDSGYGAATATITHFSAPTPLPAAMWLMAAPLFGLLSKRRKNLA